MATTTSQGLATAAAAAQLAFDEEPFITFYWYKQNIQDIEVVLELAWLMHPSIEPKPGSYGGFHMFEVIRSKYGSPFELLINLAGVSGMAFLGLTALAKFFQSITESAKNIAETRKLNAERRKLEGDHAGWDPIEVDMTEWYENQQKQFNAFLDEVRDILAESESSALSGAMRARSSALTIGTRAEEWTDDLERLAVSQRVAAIQRLAEKGLTIKIINEEQA
ncbi:MAG: hypothetical protein JWP75_3426 [Frondihabitans sp.]|nr:hypothetical protein [Frondihabitans sp.]